MEPTPKKKSYRKAQRANHRTTADAAWYQLKQFIKYKAEWYGKEMREVSTFYPSSQMCHICGHRNAFVSDDPNLAHYVCEGCGAELDRDQNAAINIREKVMNPAYLDEEIRTSKKNKNTNQK